MNTALRWLATQDPLGRAIYAQGLRCSNAIIEAEWLGESEFVAINTIVIKNIANEYIVSTTPWEHIMSPNGVVSYNEMVNF